MKKYVKNRNHYIILEYFKYDAHLLSQEIYDTCLSKIMYAFYYKETKSYFDLREKIEEYIHQNNYLKPIFVLFQILLDIATTDNYYKLVDITKDKLEYINLFPKEYFTPKLEYLVLLVKYYFNQKVNEISLKNYSLEFIELSWLYNFFKGNKEYLNKNDYEAIVYYEMALKDYKENFNISRIVSTINTLSFIHNAHDQYELSIEKSSIILQHVFYQEEEKKWKNFILTHYLYSLFMLDRYDEIQNFFRIQSLTVESLHINSVIIGILTARKLKIPFQKMNPILEEISRKDEEIKLFLNILDKKIEKEKINELKCSSTYYFMKIAEKLKLDI